LIENLALLEEREFFEIIQSSRNRHVTQNGAPVDNVGIGGTLDLQRIGNHVPKTNPVECIRIAKKTIQMAIY
jgi:hypothetical protein